jgi:hypothetical protein
MSAPDFSKEPPGRFVQVADGFWVAATKHHPGGSKHSPEINNRCIAFRLEENGEPVLVVLNSVDVAIIPELRKLEAETGLTVRHVVSPG